jgi:aminoglycoside phosphotransferase (APT) family kinase protein
MDSSTTEELVASLRRMNLVSASERPVITPLAGGVSSLIARVDTPARSFCIKRALPKLKVAADWKAPVERNIAEAAWIRLAGRIVPGLVPEILGQDVEGMTFAMAFLDPARHPVWKSLLRDGIADPATARRLAENVVAIHRATAGDREVARQFATDASFFALRLDPYFAATAAAHPDVAAALERLIDTTARTKLALVHGDVSPKNVLVGPTGPVLLDAECAWYGDPAFDLSFCLTHLLLKCEWRPASRAAFLRCFDVLAESYLDGVAWESREALEARACRLLAGMLLARIDGHSPVEYLTDERRREGVRRRAKRFLNEPARRLADVRAAWADDDVR